MNACDVISARLACLGILVNCVIAESGRENRAAWFNML
jgi:hypothetical protein